MQFFTCTKISSHLAAGRPQGYYSTLEGLNIGYHVFKDYIMILKIRATLKRQYSIYKHLSQKDQFQF